MSEINPLKQKILKQVEHFLEVDDLSVFHVCFFMQSMRVLLEIENKKSKYVVTNHYCNWLFHKEINYSHSPIIIQEIADSFKNFESKNDLIKNINEALSLKKLVMELKELLWLEIPDKVAVSRFDFEDYWLKFLQVILNQLLFRPIKLIKKNIYINDLEFSIYGLEVVAERNHYCLELLSKELKSKNKRFTIDIALGK